MFADLTEDGQRAGLGLRCYMKNWAWSRASRCPADSCGTCVYLAARSSRICAGEGERGGEGPTAKTTF